MKQEIITPIYYYEDDNGNKIIDEECMREEFEHSILKLNRL